MMNDGRNTRPLYVLVATGRNEFGDRWKCVGRYAFLDRKAADAALSGFLENCMEPTGRITDPEPESVKASVTALDLHDDLPKGEPAEVFLVNARGPSAVFNGYFECLSARAFTVRQAADRWAEEDFRSRCIDPDGGLDYGLAEGLVTTLVRLDVGSAPEPEPSLPGGP